MKYVGSSELLAVNDISSGTSAPMIYITWFWREQLRLDADESEKKRALLLRCDGIPWPGAPQSPDESEENAGDLLALYLAP